MSKALVAAEPFPYGEIEDGKVIGELQKLAKAFEKAEGKALDAALSAGRVFKESHDLLAKVGRGGKWSKWLESECGVSESTAKRQMNAFVAFENQSNLDRFSVSATYVLSSDSCPEAAMKAAEKLANKGQFITHKLAQELKAKHTPKQLPPVTEDDHDQTDPEDTLEDVDESGVGGDESPEVASGEPVHGGAEGVPEEEEAGGGDGGGGAAESAADGPVLTGSVVLDAIDRQVPAYLKEKHAAAALILSTASKLDAVKRDVEKLATEPGGEFLSRAKVTEALKDLKGQIAQSRYWSECPRCQGKPAKKCTKCLGAGFLPFAKRGTLSADDKLYLGVE